MDKENRKTIAMRYPKNTKAITPELMKRKKSDEPHCRPPIPEVCLFVFIFNILISTENFCVYNYFLFIQQLVLL